MEIEYQTILMAGLIHDIGKFLQRSDFKGSLRVTGKHPEASANFVKAKAEVFSKVTDVDLLVELVQRHHETDYFPEHLRVQHAPEEIRHLAYLVSTADNYSSSERGEDSHLPQDFKTVPLASLFARLKLDKDTPTPSRYKLHPLNPSSAFPEKFTSLDKQQTNKFITKFGEEFDRITKRIDTGNFEVLFSHLLSLLQRFTWCIPSNTKDEYPDVSLYDHLRTTSAICGCLYQYHKDGNFDQNSIIDSNTDKFRLVLGDISGIQKYIFEIAGIGVGGVAKRLRARSMYLSALAEAISHKIIHDFNLPISNIIMSAGGKFYVLVPNLAGSEDKINELQEQLDYWFVKSYYGELSLNLAQLPFNGSEFGSFGEILAATAARLNQRKKTPLQSYFVQGGCWNSDNFLLAKDTGSAAGICQCCHKRIGRHTNEDGQRLCDNCYRDGNLGKVLANANYLAFCKDENIPEKYKTFQLYDKYQVLVLREPPSPDLPAYLVYKLNETTLEDIPKHPAQLKFMANYIPLADEDSSQDCPGCSESQCPAPLEPLYFDCLANQAKGRKLLGYLKADVDNLGSLFVYGLREETRDRNSISRLATMSRMLDLFFSGRIEQLLNTTFNRCYTVYSGGDDLLIIGPWDEIVSLAHTINDEFNRFTNQNPNISLSAGIGLAKPRMPLSRSVSVADEALEESKEKVLHGEQEGRNQVTFLGSTMKWEKFNEILPVAKQVAGWLQNDVISSSFVRKLATYAKMHNDYYLNGNIRGLRYIPLLTYDISRNFPELNDIKDKEDKELKDARLWLENLKDKNHDHTINLNFITNYAIMSKG